MADPDFAACFGRVIVEHALMLRTEQKVIFTLQSAAPLDKGLCARLLASLQPDYEGYELLIHNCYPYASLTEETLQDLFEEMKKDSIPINGFLDRCTLALEGKHITVGVRNGTGFLRDLEFDRLLADRVESHTGERPTVTLVSAAGEAERRELEKKLEEKAAPPVVQFEAKRTGPTIQVEGLDLTDKPVQIFHGKMFKPKDLTPLKNLGGEGGKCMIWGDVFATEVKGSFRKMYSVSITDYTGSINLKVRAQEGEDCSKWEGIKNGTTLLVRGDCAYDKYEHDYIVYPYDVLIVERRHREDHAPQKRVELHLHTKLSALDGFCDPGGIVKLAHKMGHPAIAITDHGVCQGYPEAMLAADDIHKSDPNFKLIYGCEAYFVDDMVPCVYGTQDQPLKGEFCVFDTETTGLDPGCEYLTEIGAVLVRDGEVVDEFDTFVKPPKSITPKITELTGITNEMVADAPLEGEALQAFLDFAGGRVLVAHNANGFDIRFMRAAAKRSGIKFEPTYIDTLTMAQTMYPGLHNYKQGTINKHLELPDYEAHRACEDAGALGRIFCVMLRDLEEKQITDISGINTGLGGNREVLKKKYYHIILLVKNQSGLKNLYQIVSKAHLDYFFKKPRVPRSLLNQYREGLLITSACEAGELYRAIVDERPYEELKKIAAYYDILEVQPLGNNAYMVREGRVDSIERVKDFNRTVIRLGEDLHKPVIATGDVHFQEPEDAIYRTVMQAAGGYKDADHQPPLYYRTTEDMLAQFDYLPPEKALEIVVTNPNKIAAMVDNTVRAIPRGTYPPSIEGAEEQLREATWKRAKEDYGDPLPDLVRERLQKELDSICGHGYAVLYVIAVKLVAYSNAGGYQVGSRGSVGSSAVAHFSGISEVNSLPPHYRCPKCKHSEFITDGSVEDGFDLPDKDCPVCGTPMLVDGHDIPFETFLGFYGDKEPDIDLNFSGEYQSSVHRYTEELFGKENVFKAGTVSGIQDKTAYGYVKRYLEERGMTVNHAEENRLTLGCTGVKRTTGQHPAGMVVLPKDYEIYQFTAIQHPADDMTSETVTTHFDFGSMHDVLVKLDVLGHDDPTMLRRLQDLTGIPPRKVPLNDPEVFKNILSLFSTPEALGLTAEELGVPTGTLGIPEFGTRFVRGMLVETRPSTMEELIRISGLSHGTDVWVGNTQDLVHAGVPLSECICTRDDIMNALIDFGVDSEIAFKTMESVRKGKGLQPFMEEAIQAVDAPDWYIGSCKKIKYMFPKAHAVAYVTMGLRIAYFKIYYPSAYYACYLMRNADAFDGSRMVTSNVDVLRSMIEEINGLERSERERKDDEVSILEILIEMNLRGVHLRPVDMYRSAVTDFLLEEDGTILPPLTSLPGVGQQAAEAFAAAREGAPFISQDDMLRRKAPKSVVESLRAAGCLQGLPETSQVSLFEFGM